MLLADAIARDEVQLSTTVSEVLADLAGTDVADVTLQELCTHTSGLPRLPGGPIFLFKAWLALLFGLNPYVGQSTNRVARQAGRQRLRNRGRYLYSNLGGALLGQVVARRAGLDYSAALSRRILGPLGMSGAGVTTAEWKAPLGWSGLGLPRAAWTMGGYAPAGGVMATVADLEVLARGGRARTGLPPAH
jgi:CubicO group peptidase (beta-lactamase class C family)